LHKNETVGVKAYIVNCKNIVKFALKMSVYC